MLRQDCLVGFIFAMVLLESIGTAFESFTVFLGWLAIGSIWRGVLGFGGLLCLGLNGC
jgi:hypothetical protein